MKDKINMNRGRDRDRTARQVINFLPSVTELFLYLLTIILILGAFIFRIH